MQFPQAVPLLPTIDKDNCLYFQKGVCQICQRFCPAGAVDFDQKAEEITLDVSTMIVATGFDLFDPSVIKEFGYKKYKNVLTALELERLVNAAGPTGGKLLRPSDNKMAHKIAFIQCVGSRSQRDGRGFPYCSSACCMYATKEALIIKEHDPESDVSIFYNELMVFGKGFQDFLNRAKQDYGVKYIRGRPGEILEDPQTKDLTLVFEDTLNRKINSSKVDLVVLCTALIPRPDNRKLANILGVELDEYGFFKNRDPIYAPLDTNVPGVFICGYCQAPKDIPESVAQASGAAARAAEIVVSAAHVEV